MEESDDHGSYDSYRLQTGGAGRSSAVGKKHASNVISDSSAKISVLMDYIITLASGKDRASEGSCYSNVLCGRDSCTVSNLLFVLEAGLVASMDPSETTSSPDPVKVLVSRMSPSLLRLHVVSPRRLRKITRASMKKLRCVSPLRRRDPRTVRVTQRGSANLKLHARRLVICSRP